MNANKSTRCTYGRGDEMIIEEKEHYTEIELKLADGTIVGTAEIEPNEKMLERFVIFEPYQNKGHGQQVLSDLIDAYGIRKLWVRSDNERAIHVYEKAGFRREKETMFEMRRK
jgi:RimJ/RimL family protein N-acetyltransferase